MSERLTDEQLREWANGTFGVDSIATELLVLRARVAQLEAALKDCKRYAEDHDDEWVPFTVDEALKDAPQ